MLNGRRNTEILELLNEKVCGHFEAKKALINLINRSKIRHHQKWIEMIDKDYLLPAHKLLLIGQSGTGKTFLIESLQEIVDFPLIRIDATKLNPTGASGGVKDEDLRRKILSTANQYCESKSGYYHSVDGTIDQMVIFIDEIDKLATAFDSSGNWNAHVQSNFLTLFDNKKEFSGVSFIFAGAFSELTKNKIETKKIGFNNHNHSNKEIDKKEEKLLDEEIVKSGLIPELVGRMTNIVQLDKFTEEHYYNILKERLLPKKMMALSFYNSFDELVQEEEMRTMAKNAYSSGQGVRALQRQLDNKFLDIEFYNEYKSHSPSTTLVKKEGEFDLDF